MQRNPNCKLCPLHKTATNVCIPGYGSNHPRFLFVGEAPGEEEDLQGRPFVGRSGKVLVEHIKKFRMGPARLTNAVSCRPPDNRAPSPDEVKACRGYLEQEIKETQPEFIVAVGGTALMLLAQKTGILYWSGRVAGEISKIPVLALMHPSYVLRSGNYEDFRKDMVSLMNVADTIEMFRRNFPECEISDAEGFMSEQSFTHAESKNSEEADMIKFKAKMRAQMVAELQGALARARRRNGKK